MPDHLIIGHIVYYSEHFLLQAFPQNLMIQPFGDNLISTAKLRIFHGQLGKISQAKCSINGGKSCYAVTSYFFPLTTKHNVPPLCYPITEVCVVMLIFSTSSTCRISSSLQKFHLENGQMQKFSDCHGVILNQFSQVSMLSPLSTSGIFQPIPCCIGFISYEGTQINCQKTFSKWSVNNKEPND